MSVVHQPISAGLITRWFNTPLGPLEIAVKDNRFAPAVYWYFEFKPQSGLTDASNRANHPLLDLAETQLTEYFLGERFDFEPLLQHTSDYGTDFQRRVWQGLTAIPFGETWSYGKLAESIHKPKAVRAVGAANGKNPLAIVVPCHRVIGANGTLTGYAGGLDKKQWLLEFEAKYRPMQSQASLF